MTPENIETLKKEHIILYVCEVYSAVYTNMSDDFRTNHVRNIL